MPLTPEEETALFTKWQAEHAAANMSEEDKAREAELDSFAERVAKKLADMSGGSDKPPAKETKPGSGHAMERTLFGGKKS